MNGIEFKEDAAADCGAIEPVQIQRRCFTQFVGGAEIDLAARSEISGCAFLDVPVAAVFRRQRQAIKRCRPGNAAKKSDMGSVKQGPEAEGARAVRRA